MLKVVHTNLWICLFFGLIIILYHQFAYVGHFGYDDMEYARIAHGFTHGDFDPSNHFAHRVSFLGPTALSYTLFGVNDFASSLPALLVSLITLVLVVQLTKRYTTTARIGAAALLTLNHHSLFYSDKLMPDVWVALAVLLALYCFHQHRYVDSTRGLKHGILFGASVLFGFLAKGTILLFIPAVIVIGLTDIICSREVKFWIVSACSTLLLFVLYLVVMKVFTGAYFSRFDAIQANAYLNKCSYLDQPPSYLMDRITSGFWKMMTEHYMLTAAVCTFSCTWMILKKKWSQEPALFWLLSTALLMLSSAFMTTSFEGYSPMCLDPRHYLFIIPIAAVASAPFFEHIHQSLSCRIILFLEILLLSMIAFNEQLEALQLLYIPLLLVGFVVLALPFDQPWIRWFSLICFIAGLSIKPISMYNFARAKDYTSHWEHLEQHLQNKNEPTVILTNTVQKSLADYYQSFDTTSTPIFVDYNKLETVKKVDGYRVLLYENFYSWFLSTNKNNRPGFVKDAPTTYELIDSTNYSKLYQLPYFPVSRPLFTTFRDSRDVATKWGEWSNKATTPEPSYEVLHDYSSSYTIALDSIPNQHISFTFGGEIKTVRETNTHIVTQIADSLFTESYMWHGVPTNTFIKSFDHWWPASSNHIINKAHYPPGSYLRAYFWQADQPDSLLHIQNMYATIANFDQSDTTAIKQRRD